MNISQVKTIIVKIINIIIIITQLFQLITKAWLSSTTRVQYNKETTFLYQHLFFAIQCSKVINSHCTFGTQQNINKDKFNQSITNQSINQSTNQSSYSRMM